MEIEVLICTCNDGIEKAVTVPLSAVPGVSYLIMHQRFDDGSEKDYSKEIACVANRADIRIEVSNSRGLARNRNAALSHAKGDIVLFADDDVTLVEGFNTVLSNEFSQDTSAGVITFQVMTPDGQPYKSYKLNGFKHSYISAMRVSSVEVAIRRSFVGAQGIKFDTQFGLGELYPACEENIFLADALRAKIPCKFVPKYIVQHPAESSGSAWDTVESIQVRGALMRRVFGFIGAPLLLIFALRQHKNYAPQFSLKMFLVESFKVFFKFRK